MFGREQLQREYSSTQAGLDVKKVKIIKTAVFQLYPLQNEQARKALWMRRVEKINTDVRYLFKISMKKYAWLDIGL